MTTVPVVIVVDDDPSVRSSLKFLIGSIGLPVESFDSAKALLQRKLPDAPSCLVLDVRLRVLSSLDFQRELAASKLQYADNLHHRSRGYSNECSSDEGAGKRQKSLAN